MNSLTVVLSILITLSAQMLGMAEETETYKPLNKLRTAWLQTITGKREALESKYRDWVKKLADRANASNKIEKALLLEKELKALDQQKTEIVRIPEWSSTPEAALKIPRATYQRQIRKMLKEEEARYREQLEELQESLDRKKQPELASAVRFEILKSIQGSKILQENPSPFPESAKQLTLYLTDTTWDAKEQRNFGGESPRHGMFSFLDSGLLEMPYHSTLWQARDRRHIIMSHEESHWHFDIFFSEDMKSFTSKEVGRSELQWIAERN